MAQKPEIKYAVTKGRDGTFCLGFDNLTKAEAAEYLLLLARQQDQRGEPVVNDGAAIQTAERNRRQKDEMVAGLVDIARA